MKHALVIGCNGQDGSYLVEHLRREAYQVTGVGRDGFDIEEPLQIRDLVGSLRPDEIYYLAAFHHSAEAVPLDDRELIERSFAVNTMPLNSVLHAVGDTGCEARVFYAASSHVFGEPERDLQDENAPFRPNGAYGISKAAGVEIARYYRRLGVFASVGILYNHESPRRASGFVSQKIVRAAVRISQGQQERLTLADLEAVVDWGYAPDYVDAMWRILQLDTPDDFVISSGEVHSVRELVEAAFGAVSLDWSKYVDVDPRVMKKARSTRLQGDSSRLRTRTAWAPRVTFREMVLEMVRAESANAIYQS